MSELLVRSMQWESDGVLSLRLVDPGGADLAPWEPGAHIDIAPPDGSAPERQYSLCSDPADRSSWRIGVLREPDSRGGSAWIHDVLRPGDLVSVSGPRNHFELEEGGEPYLLIGGGIGITPLLGMARRLEQIGARWRLVYGGRRAASMAFLGELEAYGDKVVVMPQDEFGHLPLAELISADGEAGSVYCCGPEPLLEAVEKHCTDTPHVLRLERFSAVFTAPTEGTLDTFEVEIASTGAVFTVTPGVSITEVVEQAGVETDSSCLEGVCGTCEVRVLSGVPEHRDSILTADEKAKGDSMMICVGRSRTPRLVLDL